MHLRGGIRVVEVGAVGPGAPDGQRLTFAFDDQLDRQCRARWLVEVAPTRLPHRGAVRPSPVRAGERELGGLGEARLAGPVAPGHHGQARTGTDVEPGGRADPAEAGHADRLQVHTRDGDRRRAVSDRRRTVPEGALECCGQGVGPVERSEDQLADVVGQRQVRGDAVEQQLTEHLASDDHPKSQADGTDRRTDVPPDRRTTSTNARRSSGLRKCRSGRSAARRLPDRARRHDSRPGLCVVLHRDCTVASRHRVAVMDAAAVGHRDRTLETAWRPPPVHIFRAPRPP